MLDLPVHFSDFEQDDESYYNSKIKYIVENEIDDLGLDLVFAEEEYKMDDNGQYKTQEIELKPQGSQIDVTDENKLEYLLLLANYRLYLSVKKQGEAFWPGFYSIIPRK